MDEEIVDLNSFDISRYLEREMYLLNVTEPFRFRYASEVQQYIDAKTYRDSDLSRFIDLPFVKFRPHEMDAVVDIQYPWTNEELT